MLIRWIAQQLGVTTSAAAELPVYAAAVLAAFFLHVFAYVLVLRLLGLRSRRHWARPFLICTAFLLGSVIPLVYDSVINWSDVIRVPLLSYLLLPAAVYCAALHGLYCRPGQALALAGVSILICAFSAFEFWLLVHFGLQLLP